MYVTVQNKRSVSSVHCDLMPAKQKYMDQNYNESLYVFFVLVAQSQECVVTVQK